MSKSFDEMLKFVLKWEGGFSDDSDDPGGRTNYGITQRCFDEYCRNKNLPGHDVKDLTQTEVRAVYFDIFVKAECSIMAWPVDLVHFDFSINAGTRQATLSMQRVIGAVVDGIIGNETRSKLSALDPVKTAESLLCERERFYRELSQQKPVLLKYLQGWLARVQDLRKFIA